MAEHRSTDELLYHEDKFFRPGFNDVYCACNAHIAEHSNRGLDSTYADRQKPARCPVKKPQSDMDILRSMFR